MTAYTEMNSDSFPIIDPLLDRLDRVSAFLGISGVTVVDISKWSIGQHAEHVVRATSALTILVLRNHASEGSNVSEALKVALLKQGFIPRGVAQAPEGTLPAEETDIDALNQLILKTSNRIRRLADVGPDAAAIHPYLGDMKREEAIRFMEIHLEHHLKIMHEIRLGAHT